MSVPLSAADVLGDHVVFELDCIDRVYCRLSQNFAADRVLSVAGEARSARSA